MNLPVVGSDSGWRPGVDHERFSPARYAPEVLPGDRFNVIGVGGRLLAEAFEEARELMPRLQLVAPDADAAVYATADLLVFADVRDGFCQPILDAQASGLAVLAAESDGAAKLIESGRSGCLVPPYPQAIATALVGLAKRATLRERLATGGLLAAREQTCERSLSQLASIYAAARTEAPAAGEVLRAA
jgi:glycosyltransferase involved in cell wall biosynthesis